MQPRSFGVQFSATRSWVSLLGTLALSLALLVVLPMSPAAAAGPAITLSKQAPAAVLAGAQLEYRLTAENPAQTGAVPEYNLSLWDRLPAGVTYVSGSVTPASVGAPRIMTSGGRQTLIWSNVADLPVGASVTISFKVTPSAGMFPVGSLVANQATAYAQTDPRLLPKFASTGSGAVQTGTYTQSASSNPTSTPVTAIKVTKSEPSPEHELMRGVHRHSTVYTLKVDNNTNSSTNGVRVVDHLPAGLEFLGCGDQDNGGLEFPSAPSLTVVPDVAADCLAPATVTTVQNPAGLPAGVYTRVEWDLGSLVASSSRTIKYAAGIPQRANELFPVGTAPTPASLRQAANLDNNTGPSTRETTTELGLTNTARVSGTYSGTVATGTSTNVSDESSVTVTAEDVAMTKSVSPGVFQAGQIATYTLRITTGEYAKASGIVVVDRLPDGLCPLSATTNHAPGSSECAPIVGAGPTGAAYDSVVANANGSFTITFTPQSVAENGVHVITYRARMRTNYAGSGTAPTVSGDSYVNKAALTAKTDLLTGINPPNPIGELGVTDTSDATLTSDGPGLVKTVAKNVTPMQCVGATYTDTPTLLDHTFSMGDRVCFKLRVAFSPHNSTRLPVVTDFLPDHVTYETGSATLTANNTVPVGDVSLDTANGLVWTLGGTSKTVSAGKVFEVVFSGIVTKPASSTQVDLTANLAKLRWQNTAGAVSATRAAVDVRVAAAPPVSITKTANRTSAPTGPVATGGEVRAGDVLKYTVNLTNKGSATTSNAVPVLAPQIWDVLPEGIKCTDIVLGSISDSGTCTDPGAAQHPQFSGRLTHSAITWKTGLSGVSIAPTLSRAVTYEMRVPVGTVVHTEYDNNVHVRSYETDTNRETRAPHYPSTNVDTSGTIGTTDVPAASAVHKGLVPGPTLIKTLSSPISTGNTALQGVIGELLTYTVTLTVPYRTTIHDGTLTDTLPADVSMVPPVTAVWTDGVAAASSSLPAGVTLAPGTGTLTFPATYKNSGAKDHVFTLTYKVRVTGGVHGDARMNTATFTSTDKPEGTVLSHPVTDTATHEVVEPAPAITKSTNIAASDTVDGNQVITYTLNVSNAAGRPTLHDSYVVDCLPAGLTLKPGTTAPAGYTFSQEPGNGSNGCATGFTRLLWSGSSATTTFDLAGGASTAFSYQAVVDNALTGLRLLKNTAKVTGSSIDHDAKPLDAKHADEREYDAEASAEVKVSGATITKSTSTSTVAVGDLAKFEIKATLPAGVDFPDAAITDLIPAGLSVTPIDPVVTCSTAGGSSCPVTTLTPVPGTSTLIGWFLGDLAAHTVARTVTISYSLRVLDQVVVARNRVLSNSAQMHWNNVNGTDPTGAGGTWDRTTTPAVASPVVTEPLLAIAKTVSNTTPRPGQAFDYTVRVTNTSATNVSAAHNIVVTDAVPTGVVVQTPLPSGATLTGAGPRGGGTLTFKVAGPLAPGDGVDLAYSAKYAAPSPTVALTNTARVTSYESLASGGRTTTPTGVQASATVTPSLPSVGITKALVGDEVGVIGQERAFTLTAKNDGPGPIFGVDIRDVLPANWTYVAGSAKVVVAGVGKGVVNPATATTSSVQTLTWTDLGDLATPGQEVVVTYRATPGAGVVTTPGVGNSVAHTNTAHVTGEDADGQQGPDGGGSYAGPSASAIARINAADVTLEKSHTGTAVAGADFTWQLKVSNLGPDPSTGDLVVVDVVPAGVSAVTGSGTGWVCGTGTGTPTQVTCYRKDPTVSLGNGASFPDISLTGRIAPDTDPGTVLKNTATVVGETYDPVRTNDSDDDSVTVVTQADLAIEKVLISSELAAGQLASYQLSVRNDGASEHRGTITVTDALPSGLSFVSAAGVGWTCANASGVVTCTRSATAGVGTLPVILVNVNVAASATGSITNSATVTGVTTDPTPGNNTDSVTDPVVVKADLLLEKSHVGPMVAGTPGKYRFTVHNNGPAVAVAPIKITDTLPTGVTYTGRVAVTGAWTCAVVGQALTCTSTDRIQPGADAVVEVDVALAAGLTGNVVNTATVTSPTADPVPANNTDDDDSSSSAEADLGIVKSHTGHAVAGKPFSWELEVTNHGPSDTPGPITVTDTVPTGLTAASAGGTGWTCTGPTSGLLTCTHPGGLLKNGSLPRIVVTANVPSNGGPATIVNRATVGGPVTDPELDNNGASDPTEVRDEANVVLTKNPASTTVSAGEQVTFTLRATNEGPSDADTVSVRDVLPAGMSLVSISGVDWDCTATTATCTRDTLASGVSSAITVVARVASGTAAGTLTNRGHITTTTPGDKPGDNNPTADVVVNTRADLALSKSHATGKVIAGESTSYDITVRNNGPSDAVGPITVTDTLPVGMSYLSAGGGWTCAPGTGRQVACTIPGPLLAGVTAPTLQLDVMVAAGTPVGTLTNVAEVGATTSDPTPGNNTDDADVDVTRVADVSLKKSHAGPAEVGKQLTFTLQARNEGPSTATDVKVVDTLPTGLDFVSAGGTDWTCAEASGEVTCELAGPLAPATDAAPITLVVDVRPAAYPLVQNTAIVSTKTPQVPGGTANDTAEDLVPVPAKVDLRMTKKVVGSMAVGANATYELTVDNLGPTHDPNTVTVSDVLPVGLAPVSATGDGWTCQLAGQQVTCERRGLEKGRSSTIMLAVKVLAEAHPGVVNVAQVATPSHDTDPDNDLDQVTSTVTPSIRLGLTKSVVKVVEDKVTYDLLVTNSGLNATIEPIVVTDPLPRGLAFVSVSGSGFECGRQGNLVTCTRTTPLGAGGEVRVRLVARITAEPGTKIRNVGTVSGGIVLAPGDTPDSDDASVRAPRPPGDLPDTGGTPRWPLPTGVALLLAGAWLAIRRRRWERGDGAI